MSYTKTFTFENPIHPGETLWEILEEVKMTQKELSERLWISEKHISNIINWKNNITTDLALKLEPIFKISASFWNNLQTSYNEDISRIEEKKSLEKEKNLLTVYGYSEIKKLGFVVNSRNIYEKVKSLRNFFGVASLTQIPKISNNAFAFRKAEKFPFKSELFHSWTRVGEKVWDTIEIGKFSKEKLEKTLENLKKLTLEECIDIKKIEIILAEAWVRFIFVESFSGNPVVWLTRKYKENPLIQISDRGKKMDIFWFTLFHEIGHLLYHYSSENCLFIDYDSIESSEMENEANKFARNYLIDNDIYNKEMKKNKIDIEKIAKASGTSISVVAGSICHDLWDSHQNIWKEASPFRNSINLSNVQYRSWELK